MVLAKFDRRSPRSCVAFLNLYSGTGIQNCPRVSNYYSMKI